jgi:spore germination cell wall hydrolase CwlJ-like protein
MKSRQPSRYAWLEGFCYGVVTVLVVISFASVVIQENKQEQQNNEEQFEPYRPLTDYDVQQIQCLAENAFFEAGNQSEEGKRAVTHVVINRTRDDRFPSTPCDVVNEKREGTCQFSWVCKPRRPIDDREQYRISYRVARDVYLNQSLDNTNGANFYHADFVSPGWAKRFQKTIQIQNHIFYQG